MMRIVVTAVSGVVTAVGAALVLVAFGGGGGGAGAGQAPPAAAAPAKPPAIVPAGAAVTPKPPNAADLTFAAGMVPHHTQAVEMSRILLAKSETNVLTTALARRILADQQLEIDDMNAWLDAWGQDPVPADPAAHAGHQGSGGMLTPQQMAGLRDADGPTASRLYLDLMILHHEGALEMARTEVGDGVNAFTRGLAMHMITEQESEITQMRTLQQHVG